METYPNCVSCEFWRDTETENGCACPFSPTECLEEMETELTCSDCPDDECTGHCMSCQYGAQ